MDIVMLQTIPDESINGGRTKQTFVQGGTYPVPDTIGQVWIGRGWARAAAAKGAGHEARGKASALSHSPLATSRSPKEGKE